MANRVLVVGSYPPVPLPEASATAAAVAAVAAHGGEVEVLAPRPCAAHHTASFHSWRGALAVARLGRRFDTVVLRIERGFPLSPQAGRWRRVSGLAALGFALRTARESVVQIEAVDVVPSAFRTTASGVFWRAADRIVVRSESERDELMAFSAVAGERVVVEPIPGTGTSQATARPAPGPHDGRERAMQVIAARAQAERAKAALEGDSRPAIDPLGPATSPVRRMVKDVLERVAGPRGPAVIARVRRWSRTP